MPLILWVIFVSMLLPIMISWIAGYFRIKQFKIIDNEYPRQQQNSLTGAGARSVAAQQNAWEALLMIACATLVAYANQVPLDQLQAPAVIFILARLAHVAFYLLNIGLLRSLSFIAGFGACIFIALSVFII